MKKRNFLALLLSAGLALSLPLFAGGYWPPAIGDLDGTNDYLSRGADLTGNEDGKLGLLSVWRRWDGGDGVGQFVIGNTGNRFYLWKDASNRLQLVGRTSVPATVLNLITTPTYTAGATWYHILCSWSLGTDAGFLYVNDSAPILTSDIKVDGAIDYTVANWMAGRDVTGNFPSNGAIAELYFALEYMDISVEANRRKFIDRAGFPVRLGISGQLPTGTAAIVYMKERANNAGINSGTGGDFVINGAPLYSDGPFPFFPLTVPIPERGMGSRIH